MGTYEDLISRFEDMLIFNEVKKGADIRKESREIPGTDQGVK